jgi:hypothetical protein
MLLTLSKNYKFKKYKFVLTFARQAFLKQL